MFDCDVVFVVEVQCCCVVVGYEVEVVLQVLVVYYVVDMEVCVEYVQDVVVVEWILWIFD